MYAKLYSQARQWILAWKKSLNSSPCLMQRSLFWHRVYHVRHCFLLSDVTLNIWHVRINMNSAVFDLWSCAADEPLMTLQQLWLLFFQLADTVWMEQNQFWSMRSKHGQYAKDSVIRDPLCAGREVSKAVNTSEEYPSPSGSCQCTKTYYSKHYCRSWFQRYFQ